MRHPEPKNLTASVRQKLFDLVRSRSEDFGLMLVKYAPLYIPGAKTRIPAELVACEHICDST